MQTNPVPVTILTGFLGSGKTTLLNQLIQHNQNEHIAIIENEFGEANIDNALLQESLSTNITVIELSNGCVCCSIRGELSDALVDLMAQRDTGDIAFDRLMIETTGLADPAPIAQAFFVDERVRELYQLDGILTLVDTVHSMNQLDEHRVAAAQIGFADVLLLTKIEHTNEMTLEMLQNRLHQINPRATMRALKAQEETQLHELLHLNAFCLDDALAIHSNQPTQFTSSSTSDIIFPKLNTPSWSDDIVSTVLQYEGAVDLERIGAFVEQLIDAHGNDLLRYKGILAIEDDPRRLIFQGVHRITGYDYGREWQAHEQPSCTIVLIGRRLDFPTIRAQFEQVCNR